MKLLSPSTECLRGSTHPWITEVETWMDHRMDDDGCDRIHRSVREVLLASSPHLISTDRRREARLDWMVNAEGSKT